MCWEQGFLHSEDQEFFFFEERGFLHPGDHDLFSCGEQGFLHPGAKKCPTVGKQGFLYEGDQEFFYGEEQGFVQEFFYCRKKGYFYLGKAIWREGLTNVTQWRWLANINVAHAQLFFLYSVRVSQALQI